MEKLFMPKNVLLFVCLFSVSLPAAFATVTVTAPKNGAILQGPVAYAARGSSSCAKGVASMGIYTAPGVLAYVVNGARLSTSLKLSPGTYSTVVEEWDYCGGASTTPIKITVSASPGVHVTSPANNSTVGSPVDFSATATTSCTKGVASMGIYTAPYQLAYVVNGASMDYNLPLSPGKYNAVVEEWDNCGGAATKPVAITVKGSAFSELQSSGGWAGYGQGPPNFVDCSPCSEVSWSIKQGTSSPSLSGDSTEYTLSGNTPYWDVLFNNHLIGDLSSQGLPDTNHTLVPTYHSFTYDVYFYGGDLGQSQALEFDVNQFFNGMGFIWGHECRIAGGNEWDIWDNVNARWVPTGIACNPVENSWNHLTIQVQRTASNQLLYQSITLNGVTHPLNQYYDPSSAPGWWGITVNYQMDGNYAESPYAVYLDKLTFGYE
jgi:hypothetical protein